MKTLIISLLTLASLSAMAGERGNGGDVVVCKNPDGTMKTVELFDHVEGRMGADRVINLGSENLSVMEKVELGIKRIERHDLVRAKKYRKWASTFFEEAKFIKGIELIDVPDSGPGYYPAGCELKQLIVQQDPEDNPMGHRYTVSDDYWQKLDNTGKAGTILHEVILREFMAGERAHENSRGTRYFNAFISDVSAATMTYQSYIDALKRVKVQETSTSTGLEFYLTQDTKVEPVPGVGYWLKNISGGSGPFLTLQIDGRPVKVSSFIDNNTFINSTGLPHRIWLDLYKPHKIRDISAGWELSLDFWVDMLLQHVEGEDYTIAGPMQPNGFRISHPDYFPNGCVTEIPEEVRDFHGLPYYVASPLSSVAGLSCWSPGWDTTWRMPTQFGGVKVNRIHFQDEGNAVLSGFKEYLKTPTQTLSIEKAWLHLHSDANVFGEITSFSWSGPQNALAANGETWLLPSKSTFTVNEQGLLLTCQTAEGEKCPVVH